MQKKTWIFVAIFMIATICCVNAYASMENCPMNGFFNAVGGFLYNALPWNWGNWLGK